MFFETGEQALSAHGRGMGGADDLGRAAREGIAGDTTVVPENNTTLDTPGVNKVDTTGASNVLAAGSRDTMYMKPQEQLQLSAVADSSQVAVAVATPAAPPAPLFIGHDTTICAGMVILLHAGTGFRRYEWSTGDTTESIIANAGQYQVNATDSLGVHVSNIRQVHAAARPELGITSRPIDCKHASATLTLHPDGGAGGPYAFALEGGAFTRGPLFPGMAPGDYVFRVRDSLGCLSAPEPFTVKGFPERTLLTSAMVSGARCPGSDDGSIQVNIDHGTPPFTFALDGQAARSNNVFSHVFAGQHTVIVQSDFCADTLQVTVSGRAPLHFSPVVGDETSLHNGRIALRPGGGTPPYDISWDQVPVKDTVLLHLPAGIYTVHLVDGFGCGADTSIVVRGRVPAANGPVAAGRKSRKGKEGQKK
ncbi:SprB repeat-containing protein [Chitinophaga parva]|nr:SprB repeat-containing protein [Chitinophaga parva]